MKYKMRKAALYATVTLSTMPLNVLAFQAAVASEPTIYTGSEADYNNLPSNPFSQTGKAIRPEASASQSGNTIVIYDGVGEENFIAPGAVLGGYSSTINANTTVGGNKVTVSGGVFNGIVSGGNGTSTNGTVLVSGNEVIVSGGTFKTTIYGGISAVGFNQSSTGSLTVDDNSITISGGTVGRDVYGGRGTVAGSGSLTATNNKVNVSDGTINGNVYGGSGNSSHNGNVIATGNSIEISGGTIESGVYGAVGSSGSGIVTIDGNTVAVSGGTIESDVYGAFGSSGSGIVTIDGNTVAVSNGAIHGDVYGGKGSVASSGTLAITDNTVTVSGGAIGGNVYGGYGAGDGSVTAVNNTVTLEGDARVGGAVYGGYVNNITDFDKVVAGNTLNINEYRGSVGGIHNFENYNWFLPANVVNGDALINIIGDTATNLSGTTHTVAMVHDGNRLNVGDKVVLIDKATGTPTNTPSHVTQGQFLVYDVLMGVDVEGQFALTIDGKRDGEEGGEINPRTKAFVEGRTAALRFVSQGSDLIATAGIENIGMMTRAKADEKNPLALAPFLIMQGSSERSNTGSHVDIDGFNMAAGLATGIELEQGHKVTLGAFFEYGRGTYDTYNSFVGYDVVRGNGDTHYSGGGIFGRWDVAGTGLGRVANLAPTQADGLYLEASLRAGRVSTSFDSADLIDAEGYRGSYDSRSSYIGGHANAGYVFNFDEQQALDIYSRYLWTRMSGDTVTVARDDMHFDKSTSSRLQLGGRYSYAYSDQFKPYIGAAFEHEFNGDIGATAFDMRLDKASLKGSTGIFEAGFSFAPNAKVPDLSINLNAQAFVGQRQGGSGQIKLKYQF